MFPMSNPYQLSISTVHGVKKPIVSNLLYTSRSLFFTFTDIYIFSLTVFILIFILALCFHFSWPHFTFDAATTLLSIIFLIIDRWVVRWIGLTIKLALHITHIHTQSVHFLLCRNQPTHLASTSIIFHIISFMPPQRHMHGIDHSFSDGSQSASEHLQSWTFEDFQLHA